ncbi:MAG: polysaccharide biosynthesis/export family protein [Victivallaceae bacterium]|nr:polysaccharide biosynthesis/export family protein [Victivallaceae bacterium]
MKLFYYVALLRKSALRCGFLLLTMLLLSIGCSTRWTNDYFGPFAVPLAYEVMPVSPKSATDTTAQLVKLQNPDIRPYRLSAMDKFNISVYNNPDLDMTGLVVTPDGYLSLPLVGPIKVGGMTLVEATDAIAEKMKRYVKNPRVALVPVYIGGYNFTIYGRVSRSGCYPITIGSTRLSDAIAMAGGLESGLFAGSTIELADLDNAFISRDGKILPVNFTAALQRGDALNNIPVQNGDYIYIPSTMNSSVAMLGEFSRQTYVGYRDGMTLLQALPFAGGLLPTHGTYVKVIRGGLQSPVVYTVNVDKMLEGELMDFQLRANDIVFAPRGSLSEWNLMVTKLMPTLQGLNMMAGPFGTTAGYFGYYGE